MSERDEYVLVVGGTGMLRPAVHQLLERGLKVVAVARNPGRAAPDGTLGARFVAVVADWRDPASLVDAVQAATSGHRATQLIIWAHSPHREALMSELERVAAADAVVVHVWGSAGKDPREALVAQKDPTPGCAVRDVVLGYIEEDGVSRWLTHAEISTGVLGALDGPDGTHLVGQVDPWDQRP